MMKQPELKLGRKVIAWNNNVEPVKGRYIKYQLPNYGHRNYWVLCDDGTITPFKHAEPDLNADPMNGDEVEVSNDRKSWSSNKRYIGQDRNGNYWTENEYGDAAHWPYVRFPQATKRERVIDIITNIQFDSDPGDVADEILKITRGCCNFKRTTTGGLMSEREQDVYAHLQKARNIAANAADNEVVDIIDAVISFMDGRIEKQTGGIMSTGERIYVQELTEKIQQLESERQEMIDALKQGRSCMVEAHNYDSTLVDESAINSVETALRNAGMEDL